MLAENRLEHGIDATPAIVGKRMYIRTRRHLYCLEEGAGGTENGDEPAAEKETD